MKKEFNYNTREIFVSGFIRANYTNDIFKVDLLTVLNSIKNGTMILNDLDGKTSTLADIIRKIREDYPTEQMGMNKLALLPAVDYNGVFGGGMSLVQYNDITAIDIDHIGGRVKLEAMREKLIADPHSLAVFETPSGNGLKVLVRHDNTNPALHSQMYRQIMTYYDCHDPKCSDIRRRHYLSYDPLLWINPMEVVPFHFFQSFSTDTKDEVARFPQTKTTAHTKATDKRKSDRSMIAMLNTGWRKNNPEFWYEGQRACSIFNCACLMCKLGINEEKALDYFTENWLESGISEDEIIHNCRGGYQYVRNNGQENTKEWK